METKDKKFAAKNIRVLNEAEKVVRNNWHYTDLVEHVNVGIVVFDLLKERIVVMNRTAESYFKTSVKPKDYHALYNIFFRSNDQYQLNLNWYIPRAQTLVYGSKVYGYTIHPMQGGYTGLFVRDITQKSRQKALKESHAFMQMVDTVFEGVRGILEPNLAALRENLENVKSQTATIPGIPPARDIDGALAKLAKIEMAIDHMRDVENLQKVRTESIDLVNFTERFAALISKFLAKREIRIQVILPEAPLYCVIDAELLKRALFHIISNAVDATENNSEPQISINLFRNADRIHLSIEDNGHGVPPLLQDKLFFPFYTSKIDALGLGLTITRKIITLLNGHVSLNSIHGVGTVVEITLPTDHNSPGKLKGNSH